MLAFRRSPRPASDKSGCGCNKENEVLRRAASYLSQVNLKRMAPQMDYPLVDELAKTGIQVAVSCRVLKLAQPPHYLRAARSVSPAAQLRVRSRGSNSCCRSRKARPSRCGPLCS